MMPDFALETTFDHKFTTRAFATGVPTTLAGTPVVDVYEDNSLTQITGAETLTVDFDSVTGLNNLRIAATAANGFESGKSYSAVITTGTVGGVSVVGEVVLNFTIEHQAALRPTTAGRTLDVNATGEAGLDLDNTSGTLQDADIDTIGVNVTHCQGVPVTYPQPVNVTQLGGVAQSLTDLKDFADAGYDPATNKVEGVKTVDTTTTNTDMRGTDSAALASVATEARLAELDAANLPTDVANVKTDTAAILVDTNELQTDWTNGGRLDLILDATALEATVAALNDISTAQVNAEVVDVLKTDTTTLPGQTAPPLAPTFEQMVSWLYKVMRNRTSQTATTWSLYADNESTVDAKATVSDDGTTAIKQEIVTGP